MNQDAHATLKALAEELIVPIFERCGFERDNSSPSA